MGGTIEMRTVLPERLERGRVRNGYYGSHHGEHFGMFRISGPCGCELRVMASAGDGVAEGWEHVSVSARRLPNWQEMCFVKDLFWDDEDIIVQFHPPRSRYVNNMSTCLHLWKPPYAVELPPEILVGFRELGKLA